MSVNLRSKIFEEIKYGKLAFKTEGAISNAMHANPSLRKKIRQTLSSLAESGKLIKNSRGEYATPEQFGAFAAVVQGNERGFAFLQPEGDAYGHDFFVPKNMLCGALHKDRVLAIPNLNTDDQAQVIKILERGVKQVSGAFDCDKRAGYVTPDDLKFSSDVYIKPANFGGARRGDKVVVQIIGYAYGKMPEGKVTEILGQDGDFAAEELSIIRSFSLCESFPESVERQAEEVSKKKISLDGRRDLRGLYTITIDGEDTRDIDDAISLETDGENYVLGVHIADVSEYVEFNSRLDKEAYRRGTSVYFPDMVLPMLPRALSNGACSLNEDEERYAMSCFITFDKRGNRTDYSLCESVIKSDRRMTYTAVNAILNGDDNARKAYPELVDVAQKMRQLRNLLHENRDKNGAVELDVQEAHITISDDGEIVIPEYSRGVAEDIIEQFMVAANEAVASYMEGHSLPCLYRIHEPPAPEKAEGLLSFLKDLGINHRLDTENVQPADFSAILEQTRDKPAYAVINKVMLRSMQKARYSEKNSGHFGLASERYCHFTSPIRRYPDLFVHRSLKAALRGNPQKAQSVYGAIAKDAAICASECERNADEAERSVDDLYKCAYMDGRIGEIYDGIISGVTSFGIFVQLKNTIEGVIRIENLPDDYYMFYEDKLLLKGNSHSFKIGEPLKIRVDACDFASRRVIFGLAE